MPKLYHHAESWQVPGQQDKKATRVDVPSTPPELAAWLNDWRVPLGPCNTAAGDVAEPHDWQLGHGRDGHNFTHDAAAYILGPPTKDPPRVSPAFLGDIADGATFVPISKAADIDRLLERCPSCHQTADGALTLQQGKEIETIFAWAAAAPDWAVSQLAGRLVELAEEIKGRSVQ